MIKDFNDLCKAINEVIKDKTPAQIETEMADKSSRAYFVSRLMRRYTDAEEESKKFGFIGVGCISFAQARLVEFQRRLGVQS